MMVGEEALKYGPVGPESNAHFGRESLDAP